MKTIASLIFFLLFIFSACTKNNQVSINYQATGAISEYILYYQDADGVLQNVNVKPESAQDVYNIKFKGAQGDIVYVSGRYSDPNTALRITIKIDGKIYKQAANEGDTLTFLTVSGVVPYQ